MKGLTKKAAALTLAVVLAMASLVGCSSASINNNEVVSTVGDTEVKLGVANFYIRYQQASIESYYMSYFGDSLWSMEVDDGVTYEENIKKTTLDSLHHLYILEDHLADYNISLTDEDLAAIDEAAAAFDAANSEEVKKAISGEKEIVAEIFKLLKIGAEMEAAMTADVDTNVSDEEAAQKQMKYIKFSKSTTDESGATVELEGEELEALKKEAEDFLTNAKTNGSLETYAKEVEKTASTATFDDESETFDENVMEVAKALGEGEFSDVLETDSAYFVLQLTSMFDKDATEAEKENIVEQRKQDKYYEIYDAWAEETEIKVNENVLAKINLADLGVTAKVEETTEDDTTKEETTEE